MTERVLNEWQAFGVPGAGKTSFLAAQARTWGHEFGFTNILCASFTRTAAAEIAGRGLPLRKDQISTLHGFAFRALNLSRDDVAESHVGEFNEAFPGYRLSDDGRDAVEPIYDQVGATEADVTRNSVEILRARMVPTEQWPKAEQLFYEHWSSWCSESSYIDFSGMIERALDDTLAAPGNPSIGFFDEVQDSSRLELALIRKWGAQMERILVAGDDDQAIFEWRGATPEAFLDANVPPERKKILGQSYRVPRVVHDVAQAWITRLTHREPKNAQPRRDDDGNIIEGRLRTLDAGWSAAPERLVADAWEQVEAGRSVMILAACSYMLEPIKRELKAQACPFANPWRTARGDWNPLVSGLSGRRFPVDRLLAYLRPQADVWGEDARMWSWADVADWTDPMKQVGLLRHGAKSKLKGAIPGDEAPYWTLADEIYDLDDDELQRVDKGDLDIFEDHLLARRAPAYKFPLAIARARGGAILREKPKLYIGTIHCSPPDELIQTKRGPVPIAELQLEDRLVGYHYPTNTILGAAEGKNSRGYSFRRSERPYSGELVTVETAGSRTRVTPNHRVLARISDNFYEKWVVYLMQRGNWWRVGMCVSGHQPYRPGGVRGRLATEQADAGWVLAVCSSRDEAMMIEATFQGRFGIPGTTFESVCSQRFLRSPMLHQVHDSVAADVEPRAKALLLSLGMDAAWPLYRRGPGWRSRMQASTFVVEAGALSTLDGFVEVPVFVGERKPVFMTARVAREAYDGPVYGLDVPPHHHYVSGGAIVHNSFKGSEADVVYLVPDLSIAGWSEWCAAGVRRDAVIRQFYVGITRAKEELVLCAESTKRYLSRQMWLRAAGMA